jgi:CBS domain-containing protein
MSLSDEKFKAIKDQFKQGVVPPKETVRAFLRWFYSERRGYNVVFGIRRELKKYGLVTVPDFEYQYIDGLIGFAQAVPENDSTQTDVGQTTTDPTHRLGRLDSANKIPISVKPDATLQQAVTLMMTHDFSQLPVMTNSREVKGMISWRAIGNRLALKRPCTTVRDCMEPAEVVSIDASLFSTINAVAEHDCVLVQANDKTICGIVTATDFNDQFRRLAEPFLLVGEIENGVRRILHGKFTSKELEEAKAPGDDGRVVVAISDLTFGEYIRLMEPEKLWKKLGLEIDRVEFLAKLNKIREVRNDVMHFDPDGLAPSDLATLREFAKFLRKLRDVGAV